MFSTSNTCPTSVSVDIEIDLDDDDDEDQDDKENFDDVQCPSSKQSSDDNDDDAQSSHSDCMIIEVTSPSSNESRPRTSPGDREHIDLSLMGIVPETLPNPTNLLLIYENRIMDVQSCSQISNLSDHQRITISHSNCLYSIPKRHLYMSIPSDIQHVAISRQSRVMFRSMVKKTFALGFVEEMPSIQNDLRHLIVFDDGTATYSRDGDHLHLCLCQDFEQNIHSIDSTSQQENLHGIFFYQPVHERTFQLHQYVRVKKFDHQFHNAQIIAVDNSIIKVKFYQRQAQTEIWLHQRSSLIDPTFPIGVSSPQPKSICQFSDDTRPFSSSSSSASSFYQSHQCSPLCVLTAEEHFNPRYITQNPYTLPFVCGWTYFQIDRCADGHFNKKPSTRKAYATRANFLYRSPCGRSLLNLDEVENYLLLTDSKLTIKYFIYDRSTDLHSKLLYEKTFLRHNDISQGKERVPISVYNDSDENLPDPFTYGAENRSALPFAHPKGDLTCCSCTDNCRDRLKCACWLKTFEQAKLNDNEQILNWQRQNFTDRQMIVRFGYNHQRLKTDVWSGIYECNSNCSCHRQQCTNRLVQNGLYQQLQLFHTEKKGWGLRVLHDIAPGSFINAYTGELITEEMASTRDYKYLAILDHKSHLSTNKHPKGDALTSGSAKKSGKRPPMAFKSTPRLPINSPPSDSFARDEEVDDEDDDEDACFILDAKDYGSISRFYNHSCKPNVYIQNVFIESHDPRFPTIALFACRTIRAGEEICWDYNYTVGCMPGVRIDCQCQASNCRGRLL